MSGISKSWLMMHGARSLVMASWTAQVVRLLIARVAIV
jgi:hypothetical protein